MATYNGEKYLEKQLQSIAEQSGGWCIIVRDDGSTDRTPHILESHASTQEAFVILQDDLPQMGPSANFALLLRAAGELDAAYCALADQDDIWHPARLSEQLNRMRKAEERSPGAPVLVYSDSEVIDTTGNLIHRSFMEYQGIHHEETGALNVLLCQNFVTGNTVMTNRPLLKLAVPVPGTALMHDWWLALWAAALGRLEFIDKPLVSYRQHAKNAVGAKNLAAFLNPFRTDWIRQWKAGFHNMIRSFDQAEALGGRLKEIHPGHPALPVIEGYASLPAKNIVAQLKFLTQNGIRMQSTTRRLLMITRLLAMFSRQKAA